jgi:hypothetical protein
MEFPATQADNEDDMIIQKFWHNEFESVQELAARIRSLESRSDDGAKPMVLSLFRARQDVTKACRWYFETVSVCHTQ